VAAFGHGAAASNEASARRENGCTLRIAPRRAARRTIDNITSDALCAARSGRSARDHAIVEAALQLSDKPSQRNRVLTPPLWLSACCPQPIRIPGLHQELLGRLFDSAWPQGEAARFARQAEAASFGLAEMWSRSFLCR